MSGSTIQFESSNMQNILISLVIICAIVYAFLEFRKINNRVLELEKYMERVQEVINKNLINDKNKESTIPGNVPENIYNNIKQSKKIDESIVKNNIENDNHVKDNIENSLPEKDILMESIINQVEDDLVSPPMSGLFISVETDKVNKNDADERIIEINEEDEEDKEDEIVNTNECENISIKQNIDIKDDEGSNEDIVISKISSDYEEYTIRELKDRLTSMGLPTSGNKLKLIERIISNENKM